MRGEKVSCKKSFPSFKKLFNKRDSFDKAILNLAKEGILDVSIVDINQENNKTTDTYSRDSLKSKGKYTS